MIFDSVYVSFLFMKKNYLLLSVLLITLFASCKKETDDFSELSIRDYSPNIVGKYIAYNLDSLLYINFGTKDTTVSYQVKYEVDAAITDNIGRPAYRIIRYIRKDPSFAWVSDNTFMSIPTTNSVEFVENNLRFISLVRPIRNNYSWRGNAFIDTYSFESNVKYLNEWDYTYESVNEPLSIGGFNLDSTITVIQRNEILNDPNNPNVYSEINIGIEKYAKGLGMVYKKFLHREYQPPPPLSGDQGYSVGYGITLTMFDHN